MSTARKDVLLVVRAKNEAERALNGASAALEKLFAAQADVASGATITADKMRDLVAASTAIGKAAGIAEAAAGKGEAGFARQQKSLEATRAEYAALEKQVASSARAIEATQRKIVDTTLGGGDASGLRQQLAAAQQAQPALIAMQERLRASVAAQEAAIGQGKTSLQQLGSIANAAQASLISVQDTITTAQREALAATERETAALREQDAVRKGLWRQSSPQNATEQSSGLARANSVEIQQLAEMYRKQEAAGLAAAKATDEQATAAARLRAQIDPVAAIQNRLNKELSDARALYKAGAISATELAAAEKLLADQAHRATEALRGGGNTGPNAKLGMFGLKPYELTNLGYQVNDVVTQIASGTSVMQTMAQQGGQILQLMPNVGASIIAALGNPILIAAAATIGLLAIGINRAANEAERLRGFEGRLTAMGNGASYSAQKLSEISHELDVIGLSAEEAVTVVRKFVSEGINPERVDDFGRAAKNMAAVMSIDVVDAAGQVATAFSGGLEAIMKLQEATGFMTAAEQQHIQSLYDQGRSVDANREAFNLFYGRMEDGAQAMRGPWSDALKSLKNGWDDFLNGLANTAAIQEVISLLNTLGSTMSRLGNMINGTKSVDMINESIAFSERYASGLRRQIADNPNSPGFMREGWQEGLRRTEARIAALRRELNAARGSQGENNPNARTDTAQSQAAYEASVARDVELSNRLATARTTDARAAAEGEAAYRRELERSGNATAAEMRRQEAITRVRAQAANTRTRTRTRTRRPPSEAEITQFGSPTTAGASGSPMGWRVDPITGRRTFHSGVDIPRPAGTPVYATADGRVSFAGTRGGYGNTVELNHGQRTETRYGHLQISLVSEGQTVKKGDLIGRVGSTGRSTGNHLHYEVRRNGRAVDPGANGGRFPTDSARLAESEMRTEAQRQQAQEQFNQALDTEIERRQQSYEQALRLQGLSGDRLFTEERRQAVEDAVFQAEANANRQGLVFTEDRRRALEEIVGLEWDIANARERATAAVDEASGERAALLARRATAIENGDTGALNELGLQIAMVEERMKGAIQTAIEYWQSIGDTAQARAAIAGLQSLRSEIEQAPANRDRADTDQNVDRLRERSDQLRQQLEFYRSIGQMNVAEQLRGQLAEVNTELVAGIDNLIAFWQASSSPEAENTILQLQNLRNEVLSTQEQFQITAGQMQEAFAGSMVQAVEGWVDAIASGQNVIASTRDLFLGFASDFLKQIAGMLLQAAALKLAMKIGFGGPASGLSSLLSAAPLISAATGLTVAGGTLTASGGVLTASAVAWAATATSIMAAATMLLVANSMGGGGGFGGIFHDGGIAGAATVKRRVNPAWFAGARRMHTGGIAGLAPDEVPTILQRGEEVLTRGDPRHMLNGGMSGGGAGGNQSPVNARIVNVFDTADMLAGALDTAPGEKVMINFVRRNSAAIRQVLNDG